MGFLRKLLPRRPTSRPDLDALTIGQLGEAGADLGRARETVHYLYLPTRQAAERVARDLARSDRQIDTRPAATGSSWLVLLKQHIVVSADTINVLRIEFESAVTALGGEYDGWEAAVEAD